MGPLENLTLLVSYLTEISRIRLKLCINNFLFLSELFITFLMYFYYVFLLLRQRYVPYYLNDEYNKKEKEKKRYLNEVGTS